MSEGLHQVVHQGAQGDELRMQQQHLVLQLREGQHLVGQGQQMGRLALQDVKVPLFLLFRGIELAAPQHFEPHDDGAERRIHVVYHRVGEILAHPRQLVLPLDNLALLQHAPQHQAEENQRTDGVIELPAHGLGTQVDDVRPHAPPAVAQGDDERAALLQLARIVGMVAQVGAEAHRAVRQGHRVQVELQAAEVQVCQFAGEHAVQATRRVLRPAVVRAAPGLVDAPLHIGAVQRDTPPHPVAQEEQGGESGDEGEDDINGFLHNADKDTDISRSRTHVNVKIT